LRDLAHLPSHLDRFHAILAEVGLTPGVGKAFSHMPLDRPVQMRELASALHCDNSYVTSVVDVLEEKRLAERQPHPTDRRVKVVCLTEEGTLLAKRIQSELAHPPAVFDRLTDAEVAELRDLMRKLTD
jgi:DNA-binding MarR family transcriptional regulator